jgi:hypothetical protein
MKLLGKIAVIAGPGGVGRATALRRSGKSFVVYAGRGGETREATRAVARYEMFHSLQVK